MKIQRSYFVPHSHGLLMNLQFITRHAGAFGSLPTSKCWVV